MDRRAFMVSAFAVPLVAAVPDLGVASPHLKLRAVTTIVFPVAFLKEPTTEMIEDVRNTADNSIARKAVDEGVIVLGKSKVTKSYDVINQEYMVVFSKKGYK